MITIETQLNPRQKCEIMAHIDRKARSLLSELYESDQDVTDAVYADLMEMALREAGSISIDSIDTAYLADIHEMIDTYMLPAYLENEVNEIDV